MDEIDGIRISQINYDRVCLNCRYWMANTQLRGAAKGMVCTKGQGNTNPNDTCSLFSPDISGDSVQNPNREHDKRVKMSVWKS